MENFKNLRKLSKSEKANNKLSDIDSKDEEFLKNNPQLSYVLKNIEIQKKETRGIKMINMGNRNDNISNKSKRKEISSSEIIELYSNGPKYYGNIKSSQVFNKGYSPFFQQNQSESNFSRRKIKRSRKDISSTKTNTKVNAGIYVVKNIKTGHAYFGSSWDLNNAKAQNLFALKCGSHHNKAMISSMQTSGSNDFRFQILERLETKEQFNFNKFEELLKFKLEKYRVKVCRKEALKTLNKWKKNYFNHFWPKWRDNVIFLIHQEQTASAIEIQRIFRGKMGKKRKKMFLCFKAACRIQALIRGYLCRKAYIILKMKNKKNKAASFIQKNWKFHRYRQKMRSRNVTVKKLINITKIQRVYRGYLGRSQAKQLRQFHHKTYLTIVIQSHFRKSKATKFVLLKRENMRRYKAARKIQSHIRRYRCFQRYKLLLKEYDRKLLQNSCAFTIQRYYRNYLRRKLHYYIETFEIQTQMARIIIQFWRYYIGRKFRFFALRLHRQTFATRRIQRMYHFWKARKNFRSDLLILKRLHSAIIIQSVMRRYLAQKLAKELRLNLLFNMSASCISRAWKHYLKQKLKQMALLNHLRNESCIQIQKIIRGYLQRQRYRLMLEKHRKIQAVVTIQCQYRSYRARQYFKKVMHINRNGPCHNCRRCFAELYSFHFEMQLCDTCHIQLLEWDYDLDQFEQDGNGSSPEEENRELWIHKLKIKTIPFTLFQQQCKNVIYLQSIYRGKSVRDLLRYGCCSESTCNFSRKVYCHDCDLAFCLSCSSSSHNHSALRSHRRIPYKDQVHRIHCATIIQKHVRRYLQYNTLNSLLLEKQSRAAIIIQRSWKYRHSRYIRFIKRKAEKIRLDYERNSAIAIQNAWKRWLSKNLFQHYLKKWKCAICIQCCFRKYKCQIILARLKDERNHYAASVIQRYTRGYLAKVLCHRIIIQNRKKVAAEKIQKIWRRYIAWKELRRLQKERDQRNHLIMLKALNERKECAVIHIQSLFRQRKARRKIHEKRKNFMAHRRQISQKREEFREFFCVMKIQKWYLRRIYDDMVPSAIRIQSQIRRYLNYFKVESRKIFVMHFNSASSIQRWIRQIFAKCHLKKLKEQMVNNPQSDWTQYWDIDSSSWYYYNHLTGESSWEEPTSFIVDVVEQTQSDIEWLEYWDESHQASYYYNQKTGESRWENPSEDKTYEDQNLNKNPNNESMYNFNETDDYFDEEYDAYVDNYVKNDTVDYEIQEKITKDFDNVVDTFVNECEDYDSTEVNDISSHVDKNDR